MSTPTAEELTSLFEYYGNLPPSLHCRQCGAERTEEDRAKGGHMCPTCSRAIIRKIAVAIDAHFAAEHIEGKL